MRAPLLLAAGVLVLLCSTACTRGELQLAGATMGTSYSVKIVAPPRGLDRTGLAGDIDAELARINGIMSTYQPDSELSRFNTNPSTDWVSVSPELAEVVALALEVSRMSDGAFDVTVGPLVNLWGFGPEMVPPRIPVPDALEAARARTGYTKLELRAAPAALKKSRPDLYVDLSALAKGYAVDRLAALLATRGIQNYLVEIGGEMKSRGRNASGRAWRIAIERPLAEGRSVYGVVALSGEAIATSGDYRNFFELDGQRYSHAIDPRSGWPVSHDLASVSVVDSSCMEADAMATALLVLGPERGEALAEREGVAALFLRRTDAGISANHSAGFARYRPEGSEP
jgi:thiamine biosynthesis lipoprotein